MSRPIVVDDNDSGMIYSGAWFEDDSRAFDTMRDFGAPMFGTLHGTNSTASFTYTFSGSAFTVTNSNQFASPTGVGITCLLDNERVDTVISTETTNNGVLCKKDGLANTDHTISLHAVVANGETFWFDYLTYVPSASVPLHRTLLLIGRQDDQLQSGLSAGWEASPPGFQTTRTGTRFAFSFTGVSLTWYGFYDPSHPWDTSSNMATYSVDGGLPASFNTQVDVASATDKHTGGRYNQLLFQTDDLANTNHTLEVVFHGTNTSAPLTLAFLLVNPDVQDGATSTTPAMTSNPSSLSILEGTSSAHLLPRGMPLKAGTWASIALAAISTIFVTAGLAYFSFFYRSRQRHQRRQRAASFRMPGAPVPVLPLAPISSLSRNTPAPTSFNTLSTLTLNPSTLESNGALSRASGPYSDSIHLSTSGYYIIHANFALNTRIGLTMCSLE